MTFADTMPEKEAIWAEIVARHDLRPATLRELVETVARRQRLVP